MTRPSNVHEGVHGPAVPPCATCDGTGEVATHRDPDTGWWVTEECRDCYGDGTRWTDRDQPYRENGAT